MSFVVYINKKIYCNKYNKIREIRIEIAWASSFVVVVEVAHYKYIYIYICIYSEAIWLWARFGSGARVRACAHSERRAVPFDLACNPGGPRGLYTDVIPKVSVERFLYIYACIYIYIHI